MGGKNLSFELRLNFTYNEFTCQAFNLDVSEKSTIFFVATRIDQNFLASVTPKKKFFLPNFLASVTKFLHFAN